MKEKKDFLRKKLIAFQLKIAELSHALKEQEDTFRAREGELFTGLFEVLDAFENVEGTIKAKEDGMDKTARRLAKNVRSIRKKLVRLLKANDVAKMEFPDGRAGMDSCKVVDTRASDSLEDETILEIVKNGYILQGEDKVLRKAEVITVSRQ
jgi:molecular chaperone GrpE (heat shock protein)